MDDLREELSLEKCLMERLVNSRGRQCEENRHGWLMCLRRRSGRPEVVIHQERHHEGRGGRRGLENSRLRWKTMEEGHVQAI